MFCWYEIEEKGDGFQLLVWCLLLIAGHGHLLELDD